MAGDEGGGGEAWGGRRARVGGESESSVKATRRGLVPFFGLLKQLVVGGRRGGRWAREAGKAGHQRGSNKNCTDSTFWFLGSLENLTTDLVVTRGVGGRRGGVGQGGGQGGEMGAFWAPLKTSQWSDLAGGRLGEGWAREAGKGGRWGGRATRGKGCTGSTFWTFWAPFKT